MTLYLIGLGLSDEKDITAKGLEAIKKCDIIYLEHYTSLLNCSVEDLEKFFGKEIVLADRSRTESDDNEIIQQARTKDVAFLVIGDSMSATTHIDLMMRAKKEGIKCQVIHNASILTAVGITGLQLYKFGKTTSIPMHNENVEAPYNVLKENLSLGLHTLLLLDLHPSEGKFMTANDAIKYLLKVESKRKENLFTENTLCIGCARIGSENQTIKAGHAKDLVHFDFGKPVHCLIVPGKLHFMEEEALEMWK
jgi:diphthine synthase